MLQRCSQFGFDSKKIAQRLAFLRLSKADHKLAQRLNQEVIRPNVDQIIDRFYESLLFNSETRKWLLSGEMIEGLKKTQREYLLSLGVGFDQEAYFEERLKIGIMHVIVELPMSVYQCAYSNLMQLIIDAIPESIRNNCEENHALVDFIIRITSLDISLANETYHYSYVHELENEVEALHSRETKLQSQAESDPLTGLYNRKYAFSHLNEAIGHAHQHSANLSVLMLDLDKFKNINDSYGHQAGDDVIKDTARCLRETLRDHDIIGRYGGEEFIIGLTNITTDIAGKVAERLRACIAKSPKIVNGQTIHVTASIGLASLGSADDLHSLIKRADTALYSAKAAGRNCVVSR